MFAVPRPPSMFANMFPFLSARFHSSNTYRLEKQSPIRARNVCFWVLNSDIYELLPRLLSFFCYFRLLWRIIQGVINKRFKLFWIIPISIHLSNEHFGASNQVQWQYQSNIVIWSWTQMLLYASFTNRHLLIVLWRQARASITIPIL